MPKTERDPSPDLLRRPPSPLGEGKGIFQRVRAKEVCGGIAPQEIPYLLPGEKVAEGRSRMRGLLPTVAVKPL